MSRLLFAAARGARLQYMNDHEEWDSIHYLPTLDAMPSNWCPRRIHPEDEHLQYGPISTALRSSASDGAKPWDYWVNGYPVWGHIYKDLKEYVIGGKRNSRLYYEHVDELHRSLFLLILAEALADEGL